MVGVEGWWFWPEWPLFFGFDLVDNLKCFFTPILLDLNFFLLNWDKYPLPQLIKASNPPTQQDLDCLLPAFKHHPVSLVGSSRQFFSQPATFSQPANGTPQGLLKNPWSRISGISAGSPNFQLRWTYPARQRGRGSGGHCKLLSIDHHWAYANRSSTPKAWDGTRCTL